MNQKQKSIVVQYNLNNIENLLRFIDDNPESLSLNELSKLAELLNVNQSKTAAYYTDDIVLKYFAKQLPEINKQTIKILEPSAGSGNFIQLIINKYSNIEHLIIDINDIDENSIKINKALNKYRNIPDNVELNYINMDYLSPLFYGEYDLVVGNPPFLKLSKKNGLSEYSNVFNDFKTKNTAGFFLQKALTSADYVALIMPKYFLNNNDFLQTRNVVNKYHIDSIIDFGETGFKGVLIETIALFIDTSKKPDVTTTISVPKNLKQQISQDKMTDEFYPTWLLYRNKWFDEISDKMIFDVFDVFRDRQITNSVLKEAGDVRVIKSRNILRDGSGIKSIENYDSFIDKEDLSNFAISQYYARDDVYLSPNMTYYPRVIKKPKNTIVNGSVAILINNNNYEVEETHLSFLSSETFEKYYSIARNYSTRSLNIDKNSVFYFGLYNK